MSITTNLLAWLECDEGSGDTLLDRSGNFIHARLFNGATWVNDGTRGWSLHTDGGTGCAVAPAPTFSTDNFSMACWCNPDTGINFGQDEVFGIPWNGGGGSWSPPYTSCIYFGDSGGSTSRIGGNLAPVSGGNIQLLSSGYYSRGSWYHICLTASRTSGTWTWYVYVNGSQVGTGTASCGTLANNSSATYGDLVIGRRGDVGSSNTSEGFKGLIQGIRIYNQTLSSSDVTDLYNYTRSGSPGTVPTLLGHWPCDEGSGTSLTDDSGYGNNGTLTSCSWVSDALMGNCLQVDGSSGYALLPSSPQTQSLVKQFTLSLLVKPDSGITWGTNSVIGIPIATNGWSNPYIASLIRASESGSGAPIGFVGGYYDWSITYGAITSDSTIPKGAWSHILLTYDAGSGWELYVNGLLHASASKTWTYGILARTGTPIVLGRRSDYASGANEPFKGLYRNISLFCNHFSEADAFDRYITDAPRVTVDISQMPVEAVTQLAATLDVSQLPIEVVYSVASAPVTVTRRPSLFITT